MLCPYNYVACTGGINITVNDTNVKSITMLPLYWTEYCYWNLTSDSKNNSLAQKITINELANANAYFYINLTSFNGTFDAGPTEIQNAVTYQYSIYDKVIVFIRPTGKYIDNFTDFADFGFSYYLGDYTI